MEIAAIALGFLSVVLGLSSIGAGIYISKRTDRLIQTEDERAKNLIMETQKLIAKIDERIEKMDERMEKMDERMERSEERWQKTMEFIASLIKSEGEKTRELINQVIK